MPRITIDGKEYNVSEGITVLQAARGVGINIPSLCDHPDLTPYGGCRLCNVGVKGARFLLSSCTLPVTDGMVIYNDTQEIKEFRKNILELLLSNYYDQDPSSKDTTENTLLYWAREYEVDINRYSLKEPKYKIDSDPNPFIWVDLNKCILCNRCVRACAEIQGRFVWGLSERGINNHIEPGSGTTLLEARCESCGACVAYCPTGALDNKPSIDLGTPDKLVTTTCPYCGVGCNFDLNIKDNQVIRVTSNPNASVNGMHLCVKGRYGYEFINHPDRLTKPLVREYLLNGKKVHHPKNKSPWVEVNWDVALDLVAEKLLEKKHKYGSDTIGFLSSAKCTNEENYLMNKLSRQVIGTHNIDHCARLCHSSTVSGLSMCFGSGAMTNTIADIYQNAKSIFIIGSNTTEQHPVIGTMIRQAVLKRGVKLIVADPRKIDITEFSALHLQQKPGTDVALINGLIHIILENGWQDQKYINTRCEEFNDFQASIKKYTPEFVLKVTGIEPLKLQQAAEILIDNHPMAVFWAMGITQHTTGVLNVLSLGNLQMVLGNMGVPGGGVNPLRGQNNVQGACDLGGLPNVFPGYQAITSPDIQDKFQAAWKLLDKDGRECKLFGNTVGLTSTEMIPLAGEGNIRALYILGENPLMTDPDINHTKECLESCDFLVLQEIFPSETSEYADVLLPGTSYAEKYGTFTNTERRIQMIRKAVEPPGQARPDWEILADLAKRILQMEEKTPSGSQANWNYSSASEIMDEIATVTPIYAGVSHARLERGDQLHWPVKSYEHPGTPMLHINHFSRGKGKFHITEHLEPEELPDEDFPYILTTGRVIYHWHGGEMTRRVEPLMAVYPETLVEINPQDAARLGIDNWVNVKVTSRRGVMIAKSILTERVSSGLIFGNFHFPDEQNVNNLTIAALDPIAKIPEYKVCAVQLSIA